MSSKRCARCQKTVYPLEELKCLDKIWHKLCFKCQECGMTLNMKTYKGFDKMPYCNAHCPTAKHTTVAETPESKRLAENTRIQSQVKYHEDFEKQKGKVTQVADDPETLRIKNTSKIISNVAYHGELEKKKQMEERRILVPESPSTNGIIQAHPPGDFTLIQQPPVPAPTLSSSYHTAYIQEQPNAPQQAPPPLQSHNVVSPVDSPYSTKLASTVIYTSQEGPVMNAPSRKIGSIADYDPLNDNYGSLGRPSHNQNASQFFGVQAPIIQTSTTTTASSGRKFRAIYDYAAQDSDEVSFLDGDVLVNCQPIDQGWMMGTVERTGQVGMMPANYVEPFN